MTRRRSAAIVFCAAAGPRIGYGHLVRCRSLARALGVRPRLVLRGTDAVRARAAALGVSLLPPHRALGQPSSRPALLVVDDPSAVAAARWLRRARRVGVPVVSVHDLGRGYIASDLLIDGSVLAGRAPARTRVLHGPAFAILDPAVAVARLRTRRRRRARVLIALGGGGHVLALAARLTAALGSQAPLAEVRVARGFSAARQAPALASGRWVDAPSGLAAEFATAEVAIVSGGVSLYEACALGVPVVAVAVTRLQHRTVRALARRGAVVDGGCQPFDEAALAGMARAVARLLRTPAARMRLSNVARRVVDGGGAARVSAHLRRLAGLAGARREVARAA